MRLKKLLLKALRWLLTRYEHHDIKKKQAFRATRLEGLPEYMNRNYTHKSLEAILSYLAVTALYIYQFKVASDCSPLKPSRNVSVS